MTDEPPPYVPYNAPRAPAATDAWVSPHLADSDSKRGQIARQVRSRLAEAERLICVLNTIKIQPTINLLAVTDRRVVAGWADDLDDDDFRWVVDLAVGDIVEIKVTGLMDNVKFVDRDGDGTKVGNFRDVAEEPRLREAVALAQRGGETPATQSPAEPEAPPATWEVYRG